MGERSRQKLKGAYKKINPTFRKLDNSIVPGLDKILGVTVDINNKIEALVGNEAAFRKVCYSQDGEDVTLAAFYEENQDYRGFYVDIGALHPYRFSNTAYFYERGWRGINIDALPGSMVEFDRLRPHDTNIEAGVSGKSGELIFYSFKEPAFNSFDKEISEQRIREGHAILKKQKVQTFDINYLLENYKAPSQKIDFMSIDVEGLELEILKSLDWEKYSPEFLLIEELELVDNDLVEKGKTNIYKILKGKGYIIVAKTKRTVIYRRKRSLNG